MASAAAREAALDAASAAALAAACVGAGCVRHGAARHAGRCGVRGAVARVVQWHCVRHAGRNLRGRGRRRGTSSSSSDPLSSASASDLGLGLGLLRFLGALTSPSPPRLPFSLRPFFSPGPFLRGRCHSAA